MQCLAVGGTASRGACPTWVQGARRRPAVMAAQEGGGESTGGATRLGARGMREEWNGAGKAGHAVCGCGVHGAARRARARARPKGVAWRGGVHGRGRRRAREGREPGAAGASAGSRGRACAAEQRSGACGSGAEERKERERVREKENKIGKEKEKWGKREKGKERDICSAATAAARARALVGRGAAVGGTRCAEQEKERNETATDFGCLGRTPRGQV